MLIQPSTSEVRVLSDVGRAYDVSIYFPLFLPSGVLLKLRLQNDSEVTSGKSVKETILHLRETTEPRGTRPQCHDSNTL
jgi:hypothetical protein